MTRTVAAPTYKELKAELRQALGRFARLDRSWSPYEDDHAAAKAVIEAAEALAGAYEDGEPVRTNLTESLRKVLEDFEDARALGALPITIFELSEARHLAYVARRFEIQS